MTPSRLSFCAALLATVCGTAASLFGTEAVSRALARDIATDSLSPEALVHQVSAGMLEAAVSAGTSEKSQEALRFAEEKILAHVDFAEAARLAAGQVWAHANPAQQAQLTRAFRPVLVRSYLAALRAHGGQTLAVLPAQASARGTKHIEVQSRLEGRGEAPLAVEYALIRRGGEWKIYDIRVDGESLVDTCRPLFERVARAEGIGGLIKRMKGNTRNRAVVTA